MDQLDDTLVSMRATHVIDGGAMLRWLADYGVAPRDVESVTIQDRTPAGRGRQRVARRRVV
jgi:hypothetical protein